jgi:hypothetical protein
VFGSLGQEIAGVVVTIATGAKTIVASAATDATSFYYLPKTSIFKVGTELTVSVTLPKGYKGATPSVQKFIWTAEQTAFGSIRAEVTFSLPRTRSSARKGTSFAHRYGERWARFSPDSNLDREGSHETRIRGRRRRCGIRRRYPVRAVAISANRVTAVD